MLSSIIISHMFVYLLQPLVYTIKNSKRNLTSCPQLSSTMAFKRKLCEEYNDIMSCSPSKSAKLQGVVTSLSPPMDSKSSKFFQGRLRDNNGSIRIVGFDKKIQDQLQQFQHQKEPIVIQNCQIVQSKYSDEILNKSTQFLKSAKKFNVPFGSTLITLDKLSEV